MHCTKIELYSIRSELKSETYYFELQRIKKVTYNKCTYKKWTVQKVKLLSLCYKIYTYTEFKKWHFEFSNYKKWTVEQININLLIIKN